MENKAELEKSFGKSATKARAMASRKILTGTEHAELLGLFQQATVGDGNVWKVFKEKNFLVSDPKNCAKNVNWLRLQGMSQAEAKQKYVELVEELMCKYYVEFPVVPSRYGSMASLSSVCTTYTYVPPTKKD